MTVAEVMILLIFVLLLLLTYALAERDKRIRALDNGGADRILGELQRAYPAVETADDYWKELRRAIAIREMVETEGRERAGEQLLAEAKLGRQLLDAFELADQDDSARSNADGGEREDIAAPSADRAGESSALSDAEVAALARRALAESGGGSPRSLLDDAKLGMQLRSTLGRMGASDPASFIQDAEFGAQLRRALEGTGVNDARQLVADARLGREARDAAQRAGETDPSQLIADAAASARRSRRGQWPPFFNLSEAGGYYFDSGKATLRPEFEERLKKTVVPLLVQYINDYDVDVIEVIGHTDEVPMRGATNLDDRLISSMGGRFPIGSLRSNDNAGLAIARAVSVSTILRADPRLANVTILPLSGAQMIVPVDHVANGMQPGSDRSRRRIEIRLRRTVEQAQATGLNVVNGRRP